MLGTPVRTTMLANSFRFGAKKRNLYAEKRDKVKELTALLQQVRAKGQVR